ncbi:hypothetical protein QE250_15735 [Chromatiaceae bacterium AAb-1]|nr:hypothetical protein [Chromatiaceae bacterium AAb-1]
MLDVQAAGTEIQLAGIQTVLIHGRNQSAYQVGMAGNVDIDFTTGDAADDGFRTLVAATAG